MKHPFITLLFLAFVSSVSHAADSVVAYTSDAEVPDNVVDLWKDVDFRKDPLDTEIVKEWTEDGVVCRYVIYTVGTFKGEKSRMAAFYTFPKGAKNAPAIVWAHGGGQRADLAHGKYVAKHGYAMIDYNWGGREILEGTKKNTDWGAVDPSQGPQFYPGAFRKGTKLNLLPDEHTIDPVISPRNGNWYLLAYAGRRAITFLEEQPEVDPRKIGFTGFSMGGNITSYASIDPRLKAVVPMVGGAGYITADSPGLPGSGTARGYRDHVDLFAATMESQSYYAHTKCPVLLLNASDDFHGRFEFVYRCMDALPHDNWRVSQTMHLSHNLGPETWILMNLWFDKHLKGEAVEIPETASATLAIKGDSATFTTAPDQPGELASLDIYYTHDPNPKSRFWIAAEAAEKDGVWTATLPVREKLPLYAFANCTYPLAEPVEAMEGTATQFTLTSEQAVHLPEVIEADLLFSEAKAQPVFTDFREEGLRDWGIGSRPGITTYRFRDPRARTPGPEATMNIKIDAPRGKLSYRFRIVKNKYITESKDPQATYSKSFSITEPGPQTLRLNVGDFLERGKVAMTNWEDISTFTFDIYDGAAKESLHFTEENITDYISTIEWINE